MRCLAFKARLSVLGGLYASFICRFKAKLPHPMPLIKALAMLQPHLGQHACICNFYIFYLFRLLNPRPEAVSKPPSKSLGTFQISTINSKTFDYLILKASPFRVGMGREKNL